MELGELGKESNLGIYLPSHLSQRTLVQRRGWSWRLWTVASYRTRYSSHYPRHTSQIQVLIRNRNIEIQFTLPQAHQPNTGTNYEYIYRDTVHTTPGIPAKYRY